MENLHASAHSFTPGHAQIIPHHRGNISVKLSQARELPPREAAAQTNFARPQETRAGAERITVV